MDDNQRIAIETQQKFEFYFLALVFTVLGLSIQTAKFASDSQLVIEIAAWGALLISGVVGLWRMEWIPVAYQNMCDMDYEKEHKREANKGRQFVNESGDLLDSKRIGDNLEKRIALRTAKMKEFDKATIVRYFVHKWAFVCGLVLLILSRAIALYSSAPGPVHWTPYP